jgi:nucleotide-binding universal stress UspA family protein
MSDEVQFYPIKKILLPTDGSEFSLAAARYAAKVAKKHNSKVTILHVMGLHFADSEKPVKVDNLESVVIEMKEETEIKERAKNIMEKTKKNLMEENVTFDTEFYLYGNVPEIIINAAEEKNFDLIVLGHKGVGRMRQAMLGSVAERVSNTAPCPVLIIR